MENNLKQLPERFSVYAKTLEEAKYIVEKQKKLCGDSFDAVDDTYYRFSPKDYDKSGYSTSSYIKDEFLLKDYEIEYEFTFEEFKSFFEKKEEFPTDDFCVTNNGNNVEVVKYLKSKGFKNPNHINGNNDEKWFYGVKYGRIDWFFSKDDFKTSYTLKQLKELDMQSKMYSIKDLLERKDFKCWVVKIDNEEQYKKLKEYFPNMMSYSKGYDGYLVDKTNFGNSHYTNYKYSEYNKIEFNQIKELDMKERKIIGYLAPTDLFSGMIQKGFIYKPLASKENKFYAAVNKNNIVESSAFNLPKEIVEQWEAVLLDNYRDIIIGSNNTKVRINQSGKIEFRNEHTEIEIVKALLNDFTINSRIIGSSWKSSIHKSTRFILIGCESESNKFSIEELELIIKAYESLK